MRPEAAMLIAQQVSVAGVAFVIFRHSDEAFVLPELQHHLFAATVRASAPRIIVDVGANIGLTPVLGACIDPLSHVLAIEPGARAFECLTKSITVNGFDHRITPIQALVSSRAQAMNFLEAVNSGHSRIAASGVPTEARPLDAIVADAGLDISAVDFIKIDTEDHDMEVVQGMSRIEQSAEPLVMVELSASQCQHSFAHLLQHYGRFIYMPHLARRVRLAATQREVTMAVRQTTQCGYSDVLFCRNLRKLDAVASKIVGPATGAPLRVPRTFRNFVRFLTGRLSLPA
jgi:FkbM family methyltransferase